jgi:hypothetical protein
MVGSLYSGILEPVGSNVSGTKEIKMMVFNITYFFDKLS